MKHMRVKVWTWVCYQSINLFLASLFLMISTLVCILALQKYHLSNALPLENIHVQVVPNPIILKGSERTNLDFVGSYDRHVSCQLLDFQMLVKSESYKDIFLLDKRHLVKGPKANAQPGKNIPISFTLSLPQNFTADSWKTQFVGTYYCRKFIFGHMKTQKVDGPAFTSRYYTR